MITRIRLTNYKSFLDAELPLAGLTVLIGANASGKSNALEAIQLLAWLAAGHRLHDVGHDIRAQKLTLRGLPADLPNRYAKTDVELGCEVQRNGSSLIFQTRLGLQPDGLHVVDESLVDPIDKSIVPIYRVASPAPPGGLELAVDYNNFSRGKNKPRITCIDQQPVFTQLTTPSRFAQDHQDSQRRIPEACRWLQSELTGISFLEPVPALMRGYSHTSAGDRLDSSGTNLSSVLAKLCQNSASKQEILAFVQSVPEQGIADIEFDETPRGDVMVKLIETFGNVTQSVARSWEAPLLSDGTLRVLAIAACLLSVPEGTLVVVEEIDNGVHPSRAKELMGRIREAAERRSLRVLLTTHNPALLDHLPDEAIPDVVACYRDASSGASCLQRLEDLESYPSLLAQGSLGQLMTERILERALKASKDRRPRQQLYLDWLREGGWDQP
jgi:predicted ATPase